MWLSKTTIKLERCNQDCYQKLEPRKADQPENLLCKLHPPVAYGGVAV